MNVTVDTKLLVSMTDANQNFSKVVRIVDESGMAVILKNNKPRYLILDFDEYEEIAAARQKNIEKIADNLIDENLEAFMELAK